MHEFLQITTTAPDLLTAEAIARLLVEQRLAACVQLVGPMTSVYRWQGQIETSQEWLCLAKTTRDCYPALEAAILKAHPYDVPEILATPVVACSQAYSEWMAAEQRKP